MNSSDILVAELNKLLNKKNLSVAEAARTARISQPTAHRILSGQSKNPKLENINALAIALGSSLSELTGHQFKNTQATSHPQKVKLFTINEIENGLEAKAETNSPFEHSRNTYAFTVEGSIDSSNPMHPAYGRAYPVGCIAFVDPELADSVKSGDVVAAMLLDDNIFTFRLYSKTDGVEMLMPLNGRFPPVAPGRPFKILGKVIGAVLP